MSSPGPDATPPSTPVGAVLQAGLAGEPPVYPGAVALVAAGGRIVSSDAVGEQIRYADAAGALLPPDDRAPMHPGTRFDIASLTKVVVATATLTLVQEGTLDPDAPVAEHLPEYRTEDKREVTLRHLLTHTAGLAPVLRLWDEHDTPEARLDAVLQVPLTAAPGTTFAYSCLGYITVGALVARVSGRGLDDVVAERVLKPLGMDDTGYRPVGAHAPAEVDDIAATECQATLGRGTVRGVVHDENAWSLGGVAGNAGLFSTAPDILRLGEMLRTGGGPVLEPDTCAEMLRPQLRPGLNPDYQHGLGVRVGDRSFMGPLAETGAVGHTGFTGTSLVVDRARDLTVVLLTNRVHPSREWSELGATRRAVAEAALAYAR